MQRPETYLPQDDYVITQATYLSDFDQKVATRLYQPLIGPVAFALYLTLWQEVTPRPSLSDRKKHVRLLDLLHVSIDELFTARVKLEAVGLLKTYTQVDQLGRFYAYELYAPVSPDRFFSDDLLSVLLYDTVGETQFATLRQDFQLSPIRRDSWQDITSDFLDVFHISAQALTDPPIAVETAKQAVVQSEAPKVTLGNGEGYDWEFLAQQLANSNLKAGELEKYQSAIYQLAKFYGLQPVDLARYIEAATNVMTGELNLPQLRRNIEQTATKQEHKVAVQPQLSTKVAVADTDAALLKDAKQMSIREFIVAAKHKKNAQMYPGHNEIQALLKLQQRRVFDDATINILVDYILQTNDSINQAYLDAVVNSWLKAGVTSPEQALVQIHEFVTKKPARKSTRPRANRRVETRPAWMQPDYQPKKEEVTPEMKAQLAANQAKLAALRKEATDGNHS
ncbi:replication initiation and membrane attachment family protein [Lacticaseibacillus saniviri]|uniref:Replicative DNA helicase DnaB n=1 Tax=Lacticaseibacillus saniviri JCM 17471 = DSM 24301 TaxID=1293598 RepID=A0A0R2MSU8_9LACO|nr:DnaD domain protein [Lacticaseibacillus saniviri]KRO16660.1 replicative DNA helicase DnaB [Lacticaseibacillus saniviri JCM 17471 = DSM 24301]